MKKTHTQTLTRVMTWTMFNYSSQGYLSSMCRACTSQMKFTTTEVIKV